MKLGLSTDEASFATGFATVEGLKAGLSAVVEKAREAREWLIEQVQQTAEAGEQASIFAQKMGMSAQQVQELAYVGKTVNLTLDDMQAAMRTLASRGVTDLRGTLFRLADQFHDMEDGGRKLGLATEYLGRAGARLIPVLNKGSGAIKELMQEAEKLGFVMSNEDIAAAKKYKEESTRLGATLTGLRNAVLVPLLPILSWIADAFVDIVLKVREWRKYGPELIIHLKAFALSIAIVAATWAAYRVGMQLAILAQVEETSVLALLNGMLWEQVTAVWAAVAPFLAWAAAIAAVFFAVDDLITFFQNGDSVIGRLLEKWVGHFDTWQEGLSKAWDAVKAGFNKLWIDLKSDPDFGAYIKAIEWLADKLTGIAKSRPGAPTAGEESASTEAARGRFSGARNFLQGVFGAPSLPGFDGGAASPAAAASVGNANFSSAGGAAVYIDTINVSSTHGASAKDIAGAIPAAIEEHAAKRNREAAAAAGS